MKLIYQIILILIFLASVVAGILLDFCLSDAISFYLGISAIIVAIISLSIADKQIDTIKYSLKVWWETNQEDWYNVKFKLVNNSKINLSNINLLISLPTSTALLDNNLQRYQFTELLADNARIYQTDILKYFPAKNFEYIVEIKLELPQWKEDNIIFVLTADKFKSKVIQMNHADLKQINKANSIEKAITFK